MDIFIFIEVWNTKYLFKAAKNWLVIKWQYNKARKDQ